MANHSDMPQRLVKLVREYERLGSSEKRKTPKGRALLENIHTAGRTAAFFDGFDGMKRLHDAAEDLVGNDNSVGYWLNRMWDGIGGWAA